jgi:hypothetical protein
VRLVGKMVIEFRRPESAAWDSLGTFAALSENDVAELREVLEGREPLDSIDQITNPLVADTLDILRKDGYLVRVTFPTDN